MIWSGGTWLSPLNEHAILPGAAECASFLPQRKMKMGAAQMGARVRAPDARRRAASSPAGTRESRGQLRAAARFSARSAKRCRVAPRPGHSLAMTCLPSRGASRPSFAVRFAPLKKKGRREGRAPAGTQGPHTQDARGLTTGDAGSPGLPCGNGFTAYGALSPGSDGTIAPRRLADVRCAVPVGPPHHRKALTHRPRASGPHAFAVRGRPSPIIRRLARARPRSRR